ncbi:hypothetical protein BU14_0065s0014 [Porphyra umbilicalis]|uniref:GATA-type domain-containing protein n=1 Tax=Porphyra umbilicalis TaxID=2786 RepID=A0A1X6PGM5_PORUM|nr:hypothetical protein BU14_0065s0014 [Porphyra umbilicalis]|eukprot:OSX80009.1 hypothetical protein BU14_0065s0014 [Porphyra umbilicalis]
MKLVLQLLSWPQRRAEAKREAWRCSRCGTLDGDTRRFGDDGQPNLCYECCWRHVRRRKRHSIDTLQAEALDRAARPEGPLLG